MPRSAGLAVLACILAAGWVVLPAGADVVISTDQTQNVTCSSGTCTATSESAVLNATDLQNMLTISNVALVASGEPVDVDVRAPVSWSNASTLTLDSFHSINIYQPIAVDGRGGLTLVTNDGGSGGYFFVAANANVTFANVSSSLSIDRNAYTLVSSIAMLAQDVSENLSSYYALANNYDAVADGTYSDTPVSAIDTLEGLGNTISHLSIDTNQRDAFASLIGTLNVGAENLHVARVHAVARHGKLHGSDGASALVGKNLGAVFNDSSSGTVRAQERDDAGGLVAQNYGSIALSHSSAVVLTRKYAYAGGLVGINFAGGVVSQSYATGNVSVGPTGAGGGLIGGNVGQTLNSYAKGSVTGESESLVGGMIGDFSGAIDDSYSTGAVTAASDSYVGGLIGFDERDLKGDIVDCYWDRTTSGVSDRSEGAGNIPNDSGITGETTKELKAGLPAGFDPAIWDEQQKINKGLPYLPGNPPQKN